MNTRSLCTEHAGTYALDRSSTLIHISFPSFIALQISTKLTVTINFCSTKSRYVLNIILYMQYLSSFGRTVFFRSSFFFIQAKWTSLFVYLCIRFLRCSPFGNGLTRATVGTKYGLSQVAGLVNKIILCISKVRNMPPPTIIIHTIERRISCIL